MILDWLGTGLFAIKSFYAYWKINENSACFFKYSQESPPLRRKKYLPLFSKENELFPNITCALHNCFSDN